MPAPSTPTPFYCQQANRETYVSFGISAGATSYDVQRSTDGITYVSVATVTNPEYLDTAVTVGISYWYKVAAVSAGGTSQYTVPQVVVPTPTGEMSLGQIRLNAKQRADQVGSNFLTLPEWNANINQSMFELYDLLVTVYEDYFAQHIEFQTNGQDMSYPLPNGLNYDASPSFYKLLGVDLGISTGNNAYVTVDKFNFIDRNRYLYPNSNSTIYGVFGMKYRMVGENIEFIPKPTASQPIRLWYVPRLTELLKDNDITSTSISGWIEYVITDAAIKAMQKEESDVTVLMAQKMALIKRIEDSAMNRDAGRPDTISDVRPFGWTNNGDSWGSSGPGSGW